MGVLLTTVGAYQTFHSLADASSAVDTDLAAATGYANGVPSGAVDLTGNSGIADKTEANSVSIIVDAVTAADGDTLTEKIYGIADGGPPQLIASILWTIGTARTDGSTATSLRADTAAVTSTHVKTPVVADGSGSGRVCSVSFDAFGFRHIFGLFTAQTGDPTVVTSRYRFL
jgi:hypothetical protein